ncbi:hypothetical protein N9917_00240 [Deltaproteobacteria bacterium]|nr:hypothetical protein [Deltaproteobacteria bacterium]
MTERELASIVASIRYHTGRFKGEAEGNPVIRRRGNMDGIVLSHGYAEELLSDMVKWAEALNDAIPERAVIVSEDEPEG